MITRPGGSLDEVVQRAAASPSVEAVAVVGSTVSGQAGPDSDIDLFIYVDADITGIRTQIADDLADRTVWRSVGETSFGDGDVWRLLDGGPWLDLIY